GGTTAAARNIISGNTSDGIQITDSGTTGNVVEGNYIGNNAPGTAAMANGQDGVSIQAGASSNTIGGTTANARNVVSGNSSIGIHVFGSGTNANLIAGDFVGINVAGSLPLGHQGSGIQIESGAPDNTADAAAGGGRDVISVDQVDGLNAHNLSTSRT